MRIATDLDEALLKVSDDAHELLVHAEEREESERRLRQSLYVQTCEILGRLLCEVRRIVAEAGYEEKATSDGTRELIVGRLCYFLKFRLTSLPTLLDQESTPATVKAQSASTVGMISYLDLESAFSLADDNDDGLISFAEAMDATESAFSGTQFHGSEMLRGTLFLSSTSKSSEGEEYLDVTLSELMLLTARGLRHGTGQYSALGMVQKALDDIVANCFEKWADAALQPSLQSFSRKVSEFWKTAGTTNDEEWPAVHGEESIATGVQSSAVFDKIVNVSPHTLGFVMNTSFIMNRTTTPADSLTTVPSMEYATALGISEETVPSLKDTFRGTLLRRSLYSYCAKLDDSLSIHGVDTANTAAKMQFYLDVSFVKYCYIERNQHGFCGVVNSGESPSSQIDALAEKANNLLSKSVSRATLLALPSMFSEKHTHVDEACDLFISSLFGSRSSVASVSAAGDLDLGVPTSATTQQPFCYTPLSSSRRFALLPIQNDRTLADLQLKGAYKKEKEEQERRQESIGGSVMSSGLGFFSSMLKKK